MVSIQETVFVVDDDTDLRNSLRLLAQSVGLNSQTFATAGEFLAAYNACTPGCLVLDVRLPDMSGLELQKTLNLRRSTLPIIVMTGHGEISMAVQALQNGAIDFLQKPFGAQLLLDRIQTAIVQDRQARQVQARHNELSARLATLSIREHDVVEGLMVAKSAKRIAVELGISPKTIDNHRASILEKMGVTSTPELIRLILGNDDSPAWRGTKKVEIPMTSS